MIIAYVLCLLATIYLLVRFSCSGERHSINIYLLLFTVVVANGGYLALALSESLEEAILANKLTYFNGAFMPLFIFLLICDICQVKINTKIKVVMYIIQIVLFGCICTVGYSDIYYQTVELQKTADDISYLSKTYGPAHVFYPILMYGYFVACLVVAIWSLFRSNIVSYKNAIVVIAAFLFGVGGYTYERIAGLQVEIVPIIDAVVLLVMAAPTYRINNYYIKENVQKVQERNNKNCYIAFSTQLKYLGCNDKMIELLPETGSYKLDHEIPYSDNMIYRKILPMVQEYSENQEHNQKRFEIGYLKYDCTISLIQSASKQTIGYLVELADVTEQVKNLQIIEDYNRNLESEVLGKTQRIREIQDRTILGMAQMVESRDLSTGGHIKRTSSVVNIFARELLKSDMGFSQQFLYYVEKSAPMHDLGKIAVDDEVLRKPGKFTDEEYAKMKMHSSEGARVVREILTGVEDDEFMRVAVNVAHYHHEKVDGSGYPEGLKGEEIPIEARIMALADVFDALVSKRCYKEAFTYDRAFSIIEESAGSHFDAQLAEVFVKCRPRLEALYQSFE